MSDTQSTGAGGGLLDQLTAASPRSDWPWVCRDSTTGRGLRLYQVEPDYAYRAPETRTHKGEVFATAGEAVADFLSAVSKAKGGAA